MARGFLRVAAVAAAAGGVLAGNAEDEDDDDDEGVEEETEEEEEEEEDEDEDEEEDAAGTWAMSRQLSRGSSTQSLRDMGEAASGGAVVWMYTNRNNGPKQGVCLRSV